MEEFSRERILNFEFWTEEELFNLVLTLVDYCQEFFEKGKYTNSNKSNKILIIGELYHCEIRPTNIILQKIPNEMNIY